MGGLRRGGDRPRLTAGELAGEAGLDKARALTGSAAGCQLPGYSWGDSRGLATISQRRGQL